MIDHLRPLVVVVIVVVGRDEKKQNISRRDQHTVARAERWRTGEEEEEVEKRRKGLQVCWKGRGRGGKGGWNVSAMAINERDKQRGCSETHTCTPARRRACTCH